MYLLRVIETVPCVQQKAQWALQWCNPTAASFAEPMITFAAVESIFFLGSFCAIFWLKRRGLMPALCFSNELISHDKGLHCNFACLIYLKLQNRLPESRIVEIVSSRLILKWSLLSTPSLLNWSEWTPQWCATTSNSAQTDFFSPLDTTVTTRQLIH